MVAPRRKKCGAPSNPEEIPSSSTETNLPVNNVAAVNPTSNKSTQYPSLNLNMDDYIKKCLQNITATEKLLKESTHPVVIEGFQKCLTIQKDGLVELLKNDVLSNTTAASESNHIDLEDHEVHVQQSAINSTKSSFTRESSPVVIPSIIRQTPSSSTATPVAPLTHRTRKRKLIEAVEDQYSSTSAEDNGSDSDFVPDEEDLHEDHRKLKTRSTSKTTSSSTRQRKRICVPDKPLSYKTRDALERILKLDVIGEHCGNKLHLNVQGTQFPRKRHCEMFSTYYCTSCGTKSRYNRGKNIKSPHTLDSIYVYEGKIYGKLQYRHICHQETTTFDTYTQDDQADQAESAEGPETRSDEDHETASDKEYNQSILDLIIFFQNNS